jgi:cobalamin biosynthesis protein CobD/CbiB
MTFLSLLAALLLEQVRPLRRGNLLHQWFYRYAASLEARLNDGQYGHGAIAWAVAVAPLLVVTAAVYDVLYEWTPLAGWLWNVAVLYLTMGFRQFGHYFTEVQLALRTGDLAAARDRLGKWRGEGAPEFDAGDVARVGIELGIVASHRHVFGVIAWFVALGPAGAMLYRAAAELSELWGGKKDGPGEFAGFAQRVFFWIDWVPVRVAAATFAVVGNFEDAVYCWREQSRRWGDKAYGTLLASAAGALGVQLGGALHQHGTLEHRPELGVGDEAAPDHLDVAERLVWRSLALWMVLIFLVSLAYWLG